MRQICYTARMSTKRPRVSAILEPPLFRVVQILARKRGRSLSQEVRDLIRDAVELAEDRALDEFAGARRKSFDVRRSLTIAALRRGLRAPRKAR